MANVRELLESDRSIKKSDFSAEISKLTREIQLQAGLVQSKDYELQTMPGPVEEGSHLSKGLSKKVR